TGQPRKVLAGQLGDGFLVRLGDLRPSGRVHDQREAGVVQAAGKFGAVLDELLELEAGNRLGRKEGAVHHAGGQQLVRGWRQTQRDVESEDLAQLVDHAAADPDLEAVEVGQLLDRALGVHDDARAVGEDYQHVQPAMLVELGQLLQVDL